MPILSLAARHGPLVLILGLVAGLALPGLARVLLPYLPVMVAGLLFLAALRIGAGGLSGALADIPRTLAMVLALQLALPLGVIALTSVAGVLDTPIALALVLIQAAPSITGSPNMALMMGATAAPAMRLLALGTLVLPVSALPILWLMPQTGGASVTMAALKLALIIVISVPAAMLLRQAVMPRPTLRQAETLRGASAILLAIFVIGLMPPLATVVTTDPLRALAWLILAIGANFALQILLLRVTRGTRAENQIAVGIIAGNRNIALFLIALPPEVTGPILVFIACYQVPMYLTPSLLGGVYRRVLRAGL